MLTMEDLQALFEARNEQQWRQTLFALAGKCGYAHTLFGVIPHRAVPLDAAFLASNYPDEWRRTYDSMQLHYVDPTVAHCLRSALPIVWKPSLFLGEPQAAMYEQASGYGLRSGVSLPLHGANGQFGVLSFVSADADHLGSGGDPRELAMLSLLRDYALESSQRFLQTAQPGQPAAEPVQLTARELECLRWTMLGKSSWEISRILRRSEATINFHLGNTKKKFDVPTRQQAVVKAIKLGLLMPA